MISLPVGLSRSAMVAYSRTTFVGQPYATAERNWVTERRKCHEFAAAQRRLCCWRDAHETHSRLPWDVGHLLQGFRPSECAAISAAPDTHRTSANSRSPPPEQALDVGELQLDVGGAA